MKSILKRFRSLTVIFLLSSSIFLLLFATLPSVHASSGSIVTVAQEYSTASSPERKVFNAVGYWWVFWDNSGTFSYSSSPDGSTWSSTVQPSQFSTESSFSVWVSGSTVYYAASTGSNNFLYESGTINSGGTITWGVSETTVPTTYSTQNSISITTDALGDPWVAVYTENGGAMIGPQYDEVYELSGGTWTRTALIAGPNIGPEFMAAWVQVIPLPEISPTVPSVGVISSFVDCTLCYGASLEYVTGFSGGVWSWSSPIAVGSSVAEFSATSIGNTIYVATSNGFGGIEFLSYTTGQSAATSPVSIASGNSWGSYPPTPGTDVSISQGPSGSNTLVIFYEDTSALNVEYSVSGDLGSTWGSTQVAYSGSSTFVSGVTSADQATSGSEYGLIFTNYATIFDLDFAFITTGSSTTTTITTTSVTSTSSSSTSSSTFTSTTSTSSSTTRLPSGAQVSITLNPDLTSNVMDPNNYFLISYNDGAQEFIPGQSGTTYFVAAIGTQVTIAAESSGSNSQEEWCLQGDYAGVCNQVQFTVASKGDSLTYTYFDILEQSVSYAIHGGGNPSAPSLSFITLPAIANSYDDFALATVGLTTVPQTIWALRTFSGAQTIQLANFGIINTSPATPNEQWSAGFGSCCPITGSNVIPNPIIFYNQYPEHVSYSVTGSGAGYSAPTLNFVSGGSAQTFTLANSPVSLFVDYGSSWSITPNPLAGSVPGNSWLAAFGTSGTITGPGTIDPVYIEIFGQITASLQDTLGVNSTLIPSPQSSLSDGVSISNENVPPSTATLFDGITLKDAYVAPMTAPLLDSITVNDYFVSPVKAALNDLVVMVETITSSPFVSVGHTYPGTLLFTVHSPVNILVTDTMGRQAGFNSTGSMIDTIPGAQVIPKNATQLETISIPDPLTGQYSVEAFPVGGGGNYTVETQSTNVNGTIVTDTNQTGSVTSGSQYLGVTLSSTGHVSETKPASTPPFKSDYRSLTITAAIIAVAVAAIGSSLLIWRKRKS